MNISGLKIAKISGLQTEPKILLGICSPMVLLLILGGVSVYSINTIVETNKRVEPTPKERSFDRSPSRRVKEAGNP